MSSPIWLALHLPKLPLEAHPSIPSPSGVVEQGRILLGDSAAQGAGVCAGISLASARALLPTLTFLPRDRAREAAALQTLACWAGRFTPRISLADDTVLLEVASCLRLFGGLRALVRTLGEAALELDFTLELAAAPTPLAAQWLAQCGTAVFCADPARLPRHLDPLPVEVLPARAAKALRGFGAGTLAESRRLPTERLARRIGVEPLRLLARAFGEQPDPRIDYVFPERFALSRQLPALVEQASALIFAARRLTAALAGWLLARQSGVCAATLHLRHESGETPLLLRFAEPIADAARFERVLRERLERLSLSAPVDALTLVADEVMALPGRNGTLFSDAGGEPGSMGALLERLGARLGEAQVFGLAVRADHRPECASRRLALHDSPPAARVRARARDTSRPRPLWLLDVPEALREVGGRPYRRGPLELLAGPERIESGWWEQGERGEKNAAQSGGSGGESAEALGDIRRDYFVALAADARWLWIYRECQAPGGWFLHGFFS